MSEFKILGLSGSLRRGSHNSAALRAAAELAPEGVRVTIFEGLRDIPPYDDDLRTGSGYPSSVEAFRQAVREADAVLIATPEYNYSIPGVLKNAIDWASRPPEQPFDNKPIGIMGASQGLLGTARAQYDLRKMCVFLNAYPLNKPEVFIAQSGGKVDAAGRLTDEATRGFIAQLVVALRDWALRIKG
ncbi:NAD(P)H-dependent FMN reductase [Roseomonas rosea]|jgi:chromate reductase, NAD(P)H dehydrogenase (quinone)|uniref:NAD(P)H-dependent FMN reductase n=1 Tax=Muricoccus roseus TaxID=198092 RepID=A0A1M6R854_9PROT|nr:NADPH-dependent FMN reductase [Roseomonas rosea]SHK28654.1 NAD(P)H-dependent FMN reductase [Roseomonas rosea]